MEDVGLPHLVFSHGLIGPMHHMQVFGEALWLGKEGRPESIPRPVVAPVHADTEVLIKPFRRRYIRTICHRHCGSALSVTGWGTR